MLGLSCASIVGNGRGPFHVVLQIQIFGGWLYLSFHWGVWTHSLWEKGGALGGIGSHQGAVGRSVVYKGDFNVTGFPSERNNMDGGLIGSMRRFSQVIDDLELKDIPAQGALTLGGAG